MKNIIIRSLVTFRIGESPGIPCLVSTTIFQAEVICYWSSQTNERSRLALLCIKQTLYGLLLGRRYIYRRVTQLLQILQTNSIIRCPDTPRICKSSRILFLFANLMFQVEFICYWSFKTNGRSRLALLCIKQTFHADYCWVRNI